jgi:signal transduction histidine kinase/ActR/RegA family two-component response regulator
MREVAGNALDLVFRVAHELGRTRAEVLTAFRVSEPIPSRLDWDDYVVGMAWLDACAGGVEALADAGARNFLEVETHRGMLAVLRMVSSPRDFYWIMHRWGGHGMFNNATTEFEILGPTRVRLSLSVTGKVPPPGFFALTGGAFRAGPRALGYPESVVRFEIHGSRCDYLIEHAHSRSLLARLRALFLSIFSRSGVLDELAQQKASLTAQLHDLETAHRRAQEALSLRTRFLNTVTHEMRTPLVGLMGLAEALGDPNTPADQLPELARDVDVISRRVLTIVNDVMALDGETDDIPVPTATAVADTIDGVVQHFVPRARANHLMLTSSVDPGIPSVIVVDAVMVARVVRALLDNAITFTPRGHVKLRTELTGNGVLSISVSDTGPGVPPALQERVFEPFFQADSGLSRAHGGVGLGLAVARRMARSMGGNLRLSSTLGQGSVFTLEIPYAEAPADAVPAPRAPDVVAAAVSSARISVAPRADLAAAGVTARAPALQGAGAPPPAHSSPEAAPRPLARGSTRALIVEDNPVNQKILKRLLAGLGVEVDVAANGQLAVQACDEGEYDIIFMDLQMPVMDGFQATEEIRRRQQPGRKVPIIAVTANSEQEFRARATQVGMDGFLAKPVDRGTIANVITEQTGAMPPVAAFAAAQPH